MSDYTWLQCLSFLNIVDCFLPIIFYFMGLQRDYSSGPKALEGFQPLRSFIKEFYNTCLSNNNVRHEFRVIHGIEETERLILEGICLSAES